MKKSLLLLMPILLLWAFGASAQKYYTQKGLVREIQYSKNAPLVPVSGVRIKAGTTVTSGTNGAFSLSVPVNKDGTFVLESVSKPDTDIVVTFPAATQRSISYTSNNLVIVVADRKTIDNERKKTERQLRRAIKKQKNELRSMATRVDSLLADRELHDSEYLRLEHERDSLNDLLKQIFVQEDKIDNLIQKEAASLSLIDYGMLDSIEAEKTEMRKQGRWLDLLQLLRDELGGDADEIANGLVDQRHDLQRRDSIYRRDHEDLEIIEQYYQSKKE